MALKDQELLWWNNDLSHFWRFLSECKQWKKPADKISTEYKGQQGSWEEGGAVKHKSIIIIDYQWLIMVQTNSFLIKNQVKTDHLCVCACVIAHIMTGSFFLVECDSKDDFIFSCDPSDIFPYTEERRSVFVSVGGLND